MTLVYVFYTTLQNHTNFIGKTSYNEWYEDILMRYNLQGCRMIFLKKKVKSVWLFIGKQWHNLLNDNIVITFLLLF